MRYNPREDKVRLISVQSLTFQRGKTTRARRSSPIPQLSCKGKACELYQPDVVQCTNMGSDGSETGVQWKCEADLPEALRLGEIEVSCEGWNAPGDPYILKGSCGLEYRLIRKDGWIDQGRGNAPWGSRSGGVDFASALFFLVFGGVLLYISWGFISSILRRFFPNWFRPCSPRPRTIPNGGTAGPWGPDGGPGGPSGGFNNASPPPPYSKTAPPNDPTSLPASGPGFWTGLGVGGLGAYLAANAAAERRRQRELDERTRLRWGGTGGQPVFAGHDAARRWDDFRRGESTMPGVIRNDSNNDLGTVRTATGFGGTNVR